MGVCVDDDRFDACVYVNVDVYTCMIDACMYFVSFLFLSFFFIIVGIF